MARRSQRRAPMYLFTGSEELLVRRAAERLLDELREEGPTEVVDVRASELREQGLPDLRTGSLFGERRVVLIREAQELPKEAVAVLSAELEAQTRESLVVLMASSTGRIMGLAKQIKEAGGRVDVSPPPPWKDGEWTAIVRDEFAQHGRRVNAAAAAAILAHAGTDVAQIAEKVAQVVAAVPKGAIGVDDIERSVIGHGSQGSFAVADAMCKREPARALELLRGVLENGDDPIMVLGALVQRLRRILAVAAEVNPKDSGINVSRGQERFLKADRRRFGPGELTRAFRVLADADVELKSGDTPPHLVIERAVVEIATPR